MCALVVVVLFRVIKCPRLPEESRKRKELEERRARGEDGTGSNLELNNSDGHLMARASSPYEGNVDQPLVPPGNVDLPLRPPPFQQPPQDFNVVYNPSATSYQQQLPPSTNRYSFDTSNTVELRYIRSRTTSEMGQDSYNDHHGDPVPPTNDESSHPVVSTSTRI